MGPNTALGHEGAEEGRTRAAVGLGHRIERAPWGPFLSLKWVLLIVSLFSLCPP